jgi:myo-inositol-1(or 4)-monophosphatase
MKDPLKEMHLGYICSNAMELIHNVADYIRRQAHDDNRKIILEKGAHDFVTETDKTAELMLIDGLSKILPGSGFMVEEGSVSDEGKPIKWIVDPMDGTTNFIHAIPFCSISVALQVEGEIVIGIVYGIFQRECFYSWKGTSAYLNGEPVFVANTIDYNRALIATGFPYYDYSRSKPYMELLDYLIKNTAGIRRLGSAALDLAYVACGRFDAFFEYGLKPWDVAAGSFLVKQAGGYVYDFDGGKNFIYGGEIVASNDCINESFIELINKFFNNGNNNNNIEKQ